MMPTLTAVDGGREWQAHPFVEEQLCEACIVQGAFAVLLGHPDIDSSYTLE
ncbi:MAG: hypothetical protein ACREV3_11020 [Gammaproteobacteria bacterium]